MKKIFLLFVVSIFTINLFAEEISLFPWTSNQKDIYNQFINKGWKFQSDNYNKMQMNTFYTSSLDDTYCDFPMQSISFLFDDKGNLISQTIGFHELEEMFYVTSIVLEVMTNDKIRIMDKTIDKNEEKNYVQITYKGLTEDNKNVTYAIRSTETGIKLAVSYFDF